MIYDPFSMTFMPEPGEAYKCYVCKRPDTIFPTDSGPNHNWVHFWIDTQNEHFDGRWMCPECAKVNGIEKEDTVIQGHVFTPQTTVTF